MPRVWPSGSTINEANAGNKRAATGGTFRFRLHALAPIKNIFLPCGHDFAKKAPNSTAAGLNHPIVIAEIACGTPPEPRAQTLANLRLLQTSRQATLAEVMDFIEQEKLYGLGCGLIDMFLLTSPLITPGTTLWTFDKRLSGLAERFLVAFQTA